MTETSFKIAGRTIGPHEPPYLVAELSANHNGDLSRALAVLEAAAAAGADAIKIQTYTADTITLDSDRPEFQITSGPWQGRSLHDLYEEAHTPWAWHEPLFEKGRELGLAVFSTPFDASAVDFLEALEAPAYKIASFEIVDLPLIARIARTGKPIILSTGMATLAEIEAAVVTVRNTSASPLLVLHCISGYPTPVADCNLATIPDLAERLGVAIGLSDHTMSDEVAIAAVALGAVMVEKHVTLARAEGGPDAAFSYEPDEFEQLAASLRRAWQARGYVSYQRAASEQGNVAFRRSLFVVADMAAGERFNEWNLRSIRPGQGMAPRYLPEVLGHAATRAIARGEPLSPDMIADWQDA